MKSNKLVVSSELHSFFKETITWIYFQLSRKTDSAQHNEIRNVYLDTLKFVKLQMQRDSSNQWTQYLDLLYRLIGFSRDTYLGLGEQTLSYMLLSTLYDVFPTLAIFAIHQWVKINDSFSSSRTIGCWRDIKHICFYLKENSPLRDQHPLIDICIEIANTQLKKDMDTWKYSKNFHSNLHISNVAKHIPRENSSPKFDWLYQRFAIHWIRQSKPYILQTLTEPTSRAKAISKSKCIYRKQLSFMNKALLTFQRTKLIDDNPNVEHITPCTVMREPSIFFDGDSTFSKQLLDTCPSFLDHQPAASYVNGYSYSSLPIYHIIKTAFQIVSEESYNLDDPYTSFINSTWEKLLFTFHKYNSQLSFLPLVDVSDSINTISFFSSIGYAILVSSISKFSNRFIAVDIKPTWVSFDGTSCLTEQILHINNSISSMQNGHADFKLGVELVAHTLTQVNSSIAFCDDMKLVFFSHFQHTFNSASLQSIFQSYGLLTHPTFVFWNMSLEKTIHIPCDYANSRCLLLSGHATSNIHYLIQYSNKKLSVYESIVDRLLHDRYQCFSNYLHRLIATF